MESKDLKEVIGELFKTDKKLSVAYNEFNIEQIWRTTFGELISKYTSSVRFKKGTLTVFITSSTLKQELSLNKESVIKKMNMQLKFNKVVNFLIK